ncbi:hypothetical protein CEXT_774061 [Caerostris extrusa]|uniref:Uncharacterized protein n=1 Tax=Caerostris extrusa TaxID=172846 RepID=A0AAV4NGC1_CAEEX|nr:hypothetical protein CEXT_774061 [Caerostris extrusa]
MERLAPEVFGRKLKKKKKERNEEVPKPFIRVPRCDEVFHSNVGPPRFGTDIKRDGFWRICNILNRFSLRIQKDLIAYRYMKTISDLDIGVVGSGLLRSPRIKETPSVMTFGQFSISLLTTRSQQKDFPTNGLS